MDRRAVILLILILMLSVCSNIKTAELQRGSREVFILQKGLGHAGLLGPEKLFEMVRSFNLTFYINPDGSVIPEFTALLVNETAKPMNFTLKVDADVRQNESDLNISACFPPMADLTGLNARFDLDVERRPKINMTTGTGYVLVNVTNPNEKVPLEWLEVEGNYLKAPKVEKLGISIKADLAERYLSPENITTIGMMVSMLPFMGPMLNESLYRATNRSVWIGLLNGNFDQKRALVKVDLELVGNLKALLSYASNWNATLPFMSRANVTVPKLQPEWSMLEEKLKGIRYVKLESLNVSGNLSTLNGAFNLVSRFRFSGNCSRQLTEVNRAFIEWALENPKAIGLDALIAETGAWVKEVLNSIQELYIDCSKTTFKVQLEGNELRVYSKGPRIVYEKEPARTFPFIRDKILAYAWKGLGLMFKNASINVVGLASQDREVKVTLPENLLPKAGRIFRGFKLGGDISLLLNLNVEITRNIYGISNYRLIEKPKGLDIVIATNSTFKDIKLDGKGMIEVEVEGKRGTKGCLNMTIYKDEVPFRPTRILVYSDVPVDYKVKEFSDGYSIFVSYPQSTRIITVKLLRVADIDLFVDKMEVMVPADIDLSVAVKDQFEDPLSNATVHVYLIRNGLSEKVADLVTNRTGKADCKVEISEAGDYTLKVASDGLSKELSIKGNPSPIYSPVVWAAAIMVAVLAAFILRMRRRSR